jgi:hypothetical protein
MSERISLADGPSGHGLASPTGDAAPRCLAAQPALTRQSFDLGGSVPVRRQRRSAAAGPSVSTEPSGDSLASAFAAPHRSASLRRRTLAGHSSRRTHASRLLAPHTGEPACRIPASCRRGPGATSRPGPGPAAPECSGCHDLGSGCQSDDPTGLPSRSGGPKLASACRASGGPWGDGSRGALAGSGCRSTLCPGRWCRSATGHEDHEPPVLDPDRRRAGPVVPRRVPPTCPPRPVPPSRPCLVELPAATEAVTGYQAPHRPPASAGVRRFL